MRSAERIARALGGRRLGNGFLCRCPVPGHGKGNGDRNPSLSIKDGKRATLYKCFAGCDLRDILDTLKRRGLNDDADRGQPSPAPFAPPTVHEPDPAALKIWGAAAPASRSVVEAYLRSRGIMAAPPSLRCGERLHLDCYAMPAMVAAVQRPDGKVVAVQTTLLTSAGKKAAVSMPRITTGALGAGAVRFAKADDVLGLAEGAESALSAMQLTGVPCWACLGAARMNCVAIPNSVRELHIFAENDEPGHAAADRTAHANGHRRVVLRFPPVGCKDWNDALVARARVAA